MRHQKAGRKFSRTSAHRDAMFTNMAASLIKHGLIRTTLPKAKELRRVAEPLITLAKIDGVANRRLAFSRLRDKEAVGTLFTDAGPALPGRVRAATCASSSAVSALATTRRWPTSNWSTVRKPLRNNPRRFQRVPQNPGSGRGFCFGAMRCAVALARRSAHRVRRARQDGRPVKLHAHDDVPPARSRSASSSSSVSSPAPACSGTRSTCSCTTDSNRVRCASSSVSRSSCSAWCCWPARCTRPKSAGGRRDVRRAGGWSLRSAGIAVAGNHVRLQHLPPDQVPGLRPGSGLHARSDADRRRHPQGDDGLGRVRRMSTGPSSGCRCRPGAWSGSSLLAVWVAYAAFRRR